MEELKNYSLKPIDKKVLEDWELNFWNFIQEWFNDKNNTITIKTSGSTGEPKTISHQKEYMIASAKMTCDFFELSNSKTALLCLPITSVGGMMMLVRSLVSGMKLIVQKPSSNPLVTLNGKIDFVAMVPLQVQKSLTESKSQWSFIEKVIIGGGKISDKLAKDLIENKITAYSTFGMTETISHIALMKIGTEKVYTTLTGCTVDVNENDCLKINANALGLKNLQTNDIVNLIDSTQFEWLGRLDNAIETGGVKVLPEKLEEKVAHLFSTRFFISSLPDDLLNNKLILFIEGKEISISSKDLEEFLSLYERPKEIFFIEHFEESNTQKFSRKLTREKFIHKN